MLLVALSQHLQRLINKTSAGGTLEELPYDFAYIASIDGDRFPEGVVINKAITIDGKRTYYQR